MELLSGVKPVEAMNVVEEPSHISSAIRTRR